MIAILELIVIKIYRAVMRIRIYWIAWKNGYKITSFEWLPPSDDSERIVRITPKDEFPHEGDDCRCKPVRTTEDDETGNYTLIQHREMSAS